MFNRLIDLGVNFDWISPLVAFGQDFLNGPSRAFIIPRACGWSGREIAQLLKRHGIKTWSMVLTRDSILFAVRAAQVEWAAYVLERAGIPTGAEESSAPTKPKSPSSGSVPSRPKSPPAASEPLLDRMDKWIDGLGQSLGG